MKSRSLLVAAALAVPLVSVVWVAQDREPAAAALAPLAAVLPAPATVVVPAPAAAAAAPAPASAPVEVVAPTTRAAPMVHVDPSGAVRYVARDGDTMSEVAIALLGSDSQDHRDAVAAVNVSLQANPDRVLTGQTYSIDRTASDEGNGDVAAGPAAAPSPVVTGARARKAVVPAAAIGPKLRYVAQQGDTIAVLAGNLLGGDTAVNREAIIAANESLLRVYPSHLITGQSYTIMAPAGMSSDPDAPQARVTSDGHDADDAVQQGSGRSLRYTARAGDTVSKLAIALLGSDTPDHRELIIECNPRLKRDPDHLEAGRTYWITAPQPE